MSITSSEITRRNTEREREERAREREERRERRERERLNSPFKRSTIHQMNSNFSVELKRERERELPVQREKIQSKTLM